MDPMYFDGLQQHRDLYHDLDDDDGDDYIESLIPRLEANVMEFVGGPDADASLNDDPLPDIAFDWSAIPPALADDTASTLGHLDRAAIELLDAEVRTIARAVLAAVVVTDRGVFKRSAETDRLAAGILACLMKRLSDGMSKQQKAETLGWKVTSQKNLAEAMGVPPTAVTARAKTVCHVVARADIDWPTFLHSTQRRQALETKASIANWRER